MAYKQGVACGASVTLLIGSGVLLGLYVACSSLSCKALAFSFFSPVWTGVLLMGTSFVGIFMSTTKSEKGCGGIYLFLSILGILATIGCVCLTLYAFFWELTLTLTSSVTTYTRTSYGSFATTTAVAPTTLAATQTEPGVLYALWLCMMCVAFVLSIVTCVTSCQYCCCCQEPVVSERIVVLTQGQSPQNIFLENTNTIVNQHHPQAIVLNTMQQTSNQHYFQQPYPVAQQPFPGHMTVQQPVAFQPPPPYSAVASTGPPCHPQPTPVASPPQQQLAPPQQQQCAPHAQPSAPHSPANQTHPHPPRPSGSQPSRNELIDSQPPHSARPSDSSTPSASVYQPLIHETRQGTAPDIQHSYEENPQFTGEEDYGHSYTYIDAGPATNSTVHRSNYNPQPTPSVADDGSYIEPATGGESSTQADSQLYDYVEPPSDEEYDDTQVDPNPSATPAVDSSEYVNKAIGKRAKKPKRTR
ncbi:putative uncharacterized protein DDB_G0291608 isoform X2 [Patiria miniata]|uniref:Uncharacterized protein n=1 Tax=Patiria miniata TaxID=46514 RepID=A0A913ZQM8_PATMI|nr:putative uncharacterized protein DDB_G0291608 isoform X2 [Patiria miniata]